MVVDGARVVIGSIPPSWVLGQVEWLWSSVRNGSWSVARGVLCSAAFAVNSNLNGLALGAGTFVAATCLTVSRNPALSPASKPVITGGSWVPSASQRHTSLLASSQVHTLLLASSHSSCEGGRSSEP